MFKSIIELFQKKKKPQQKSIKNRLYKTEMSNKFTRSDWEKLAKYLASSPTYTKIMLIYQGHDNKPSIIPLHGDFVGINALLSRKKAPYRIRQYTDFHCIYKPISPGEDRLYCFYKKE